MKTSNFKSNLVSVLIIVFALNSFAAGDSKSNEKPKWPLKISSNEGNLTIYHPQLDLLEKNTISIRSAVSVKLSGENDPVFGAIWLTSKVSTDRETKMAVLKDIKIERIKFPDDVKDKLKSLTSIVEQKLPKENLEISLDKINTMLELVKKEKAVSKKYIMKPPKIIFSTSPAVMVLIDGTPKLKPVEGKKLMQVINSAHTILLDTETKKYYLGSGENWVSSSDILGDWTPAPEIPDVIKSFDVGKKETAEEMAANGTVLPKVIVTTEATELIVIKGDPEFCPIRGTDLLYIENTEVDVFMEIDSQKIFVLLSGRWFASDSNKGPWENVASNKLPEDFAKIPPGSAKGEVLTQISGTEEANDAVLDSYIPQTAAINRDETNLVVAFDGEPEFENIEGTEMEYAVNSQEQIIYVDDKYYCCKNGIWYVTDKILTTAANAVDGVLQTAENITETALNLTLGTIWAVCSVVPPVIYTIPPSCPIYPVTYCKVYDYSPEEVYVGYTPGYVGSYRYDGCMVYGTGYNYDSWYGNYYWPRQGTFGFSVGYSSLNGWGIGLGYGGIYGGIGYGWGCGGWYGSGYYGGDGCGNYYGYYGYGNCDNYGNYYGNYGGYNNYRGGNYYANNKRNYKHEQNIYNNRSSRNGSRNIDQRRRGISNTRERNLSNSRSRTPANRDRNITSSARRRDQYTPSTRDSVRKTERTNRSNIITERNRNNFNRLQAHNPNLRDNLNRSTQNPRNLNAQIKTRQPAIKTSRNFQQTRIPTRPAATRSINTRTAPARSSISRPTRSFSTSSRPSIGRSAGSSRSFSGGRSAGSSRSFGGGRSASGGRSVSGGRRR